MQVKSKSPTDFSAAGLDTNRELEHFIQDLVTDPFKND